MDKISQKYALLFWRVYLNGLLQRWMQYFNPENICKMTIDQTSISKTVHV